MLLPTGLLLSHTLELCDFLLESLLLGEGVGQDLVVSGDFSESGMDHLFDKEFSITELTDSPSDLDLSPALIQLLLPGFIGLEATRLCHTALAARHTAEGAVAVDKVASFLPRHCARVATLARVVVSSRIDRTFHEEDAFFFIEDVLSVTDRELAA